ncbi:hypothetical protein [Prosthecobacter sp.]|uniref:hypothetical protein n=1 Tax=Prosthecobacter sp. TaxID=1965333 RepID=UPI002AB888A6|nr:hypothetical protein [Prosthecobacter sp.]MDZ4403590.1 hypothetical protein [Prosthecobacter sp.]
MSALYRDGAVRQRLIEFLGGDSLDHATAVYLTHSDGFTFDRRELRPPAELDWFLERDLDIARSLADSQSCLLHLDVEYVNFDSPAEAFVDPWRCFDLQEPVVRVIESLLLEWGIRPLHLITGQGHHFVWRVSRESAVAARLRSLSPAPELTRRCMERLPPILTGHIGAGDQDLFASVALLIEFVAHSIKEKAASQCILPVEITAVHVGPCVTARREMISIDISEYGDPLHARMIRMPFTNYRKPWVTGLVSHFHLEEEIPAMVSIPLHEMDFRQALKARQVDEDVLDLARRACVRIPLQEAGTERLLDHYLASRLRRFHEFYYSTQHDPQERWPETYDHTPLDVLPHCVRHLLEWPNDLLLKPAGMQLVTRCMLAQGWHPRHIAGLIRSKFENPAHAWGIRWDDYEAGTRADFYTRLFAGLHFTGLDRLVDFNCTSTQEKGFCHPPAEGFCELETSRTQLLSNLPS